MLKIIICDDEKIFLDKIEALISKNFDKLETEYSIKLCESGSELFKIDLSEYDVVYLDINLEDMNGMDVAKKIREINEDIFIIFVTSVLDYALQGYIVNAIRYIMKNNMEVMIPESLDTIIRKKNMCQNTYTFTFAGNETTLYLDHILMIESLGHKLYFRLIKCKKEDKCMYGKLDELEKELEKYGFIRIHKSFLVNAKYIKSICGYEAELVNGTILKIPRSNFSNIKEKYLEYKGDMWW